MPPASSIRGLRATRPIGPQAEISPLTTSLCGLSEGTDPTTKSAQSPRSDETAEGGAGGGVALFRLGVGPMPLDAVGDLVGGAVVVDQLVGLDAHADDRPRVIEGD